jgi:hypothetical protein
MKRPTPKGALTRKLAERTLQGRARLYHWLRLNYDELAAAKATLRYTWTDLAMTAAEAGARDAAGRPPKPEAVRKAWRRVEIDIAKTADTPRPDGTPASPNAATFHPSEQHADEPPPRFTFLPSKPR